MTDPTLTDSVLRQGKALVRAIEALGTIDPSGPIERAAARVLLYAYKRRLRGVVEVAPSWMVEEILSASEHIGDDRAVLLISRTVHEGRCSILTTAQSCSTLCARDQQEPPPLGALAEAAMSGKHPKKRVWLLALAAVVLTLITLACGESVSPTPGPTAIPEPTDTPQPTGTPKPTDTLPPTDTPQPTDTPTPAFERTEAQVAEVVDGDTIEAEIDGTVYPLRYIGIDCPETTDPVGALLQLMGPNATEVNRQLVEGQTVYLEKDVSETDQYGRLLRYVYLTDGTFVNAELVRLGYAQSVTYPPDVRHQEILLEMQDEAREAERGLWGPHPTCGSDGYDCSDFSTQAQAQAYYNLCMYFFGKDVHRLDRDNDGKACGDLP